MIISIFSCDENGFQPLGLSSTASYLLRSNCDIRMVDFEKEQVDDIGKYFDSDFIAFSVPVFAAISGTIQWIMNFRKFGFDKPIIIYNQYATIQPETFLLDESTYVVLGEYEEALALIADKIKRGQSFWDVQGLCSLSKMASKSNLNRTIFLPPSRAGLPPLSVYERKGNKIVGNIETMRGCAHSCLYCSVFAAYKRHVINFPLEVIEKDMNNVVSLGAEHITFVDADFFSAGTSGIDALTLLPKKSYLTFDLTLRVDDIIKFEKEILKLNSIGCTEVTTALEFPKQNILDKLNKKTTIDQIHKAVEICRKSSIALRPTFITYTPWTKSEDIEFLDEFCLDLGLNIDKAHKETRLLLYKGSPLLKTKDIKGIALDDKGYYFNWQHTDPNVDELFEKNLTTNDTRKKRCCIKG